MLSKSRRLALFLLLSSLCAFGQFATMDQKPTIRQTTTSGSNVRNLSVIAGDVLVAVYHSRASVTPSVADTQGNSWTLRMTQGTTNTWVYTFTATAGSTGSNTVTVTAAGSTNTVFSLIEMGTAVELVDTTATGTAAVSGGGVLTMPNITTTKYRDFVLDIACGNFGNAGALDNGAYTAEYIVHRHTLTENTLYIQGRFSGDPGTVTGSQIQATAGVASSEGVIAFRSASALAVSTPALPEAVSGHAYSFQLQAVDGVGGNTWSVISGTLPCGLSLSSSGVISGTPSCTSGTVRYQVDDGSTTAFRDLTLTVAGAATPIVKVQGNVGTSYALPVTGGNILIVGVIHETNFGASLVETPLVDDSVGSVFTPIPGAGISLLGGGYYLQMFWAVAGSSGTNNLSTGCSVCTMWVSEWTGIQPIFDDGVVSLLNSNAGGNITTGAITIPVDEMLFSVGLPQTVAASISVDSPMVSEQNFGGSGAVPHVQSGYQTGATAGSQTASYTVGSNTSNKWAAMLFGLRPGTSGVAGTIRHRIIQ